MSVFKSLLVGGLLSASVCHAAERVLTLAYNVFPPWKTLSATGEPNGPYTEIVRELARRVRQPLAFSPCPLARCLAEAEAGRVDLVIGVQSSPERARYLEFLDPPFADPTRNAIYQRATDKTLVHRYEDLYGRRIAVTYGARYVPEFDNDPHILRDVSPNIVGSFNKLAAGRVDLVIVNSLHGAEVAARPAYHGRVVQAPLALVAHTPRRIGMAQRSPYRALKPQLEAALAGMVRDGTVHRILSRVEN